METKDNNQELEKKYDLEERTAKFGDAIIEFAKKILKNAITLPIITQLVKAGTSMGANYNEADIAESRADFKHKISICRKESRESKYWLERVFSAVHELKEDGRKLAREATELDLIFNAIVNTTNKNGISK